MSQTKPVYVNQRKWFTFLLGLVVTTGTVFFDYTTALPGSNPYLFLDLLNPAIDILDFMMFGLILIGVYLILRFLKSKRIEFYDDFAKIFLQLGTSKTQEVPYSDLELGGSENKDTKNRSKFPFQTFQAGSENNVMGYIRWQNSRLERDSLFLAKSPSEIR